MQGMCSSGTYAAFRGVCDPSGPYKNFKVLFPRKLGTDVDGAQYMLSEGNVMYYLKDYTESHKTSVRENVDDAESAVCFLSCGKKICFCSSGNG